MTRSPDYRMGGVRREVPARALKPGDAFDRVRCVVHVERDRESDVVVYTYKVFDLIYEELHHNTIRDDGDEVLDIYRRPRPWSPLFILSLLARNGVRLDTLYRRFRVFSRIDQRHR